MAVRLLPDDERRRRSAAALVLHDEWVAGQLAEGVDGPTPADRPSVSDYNQHVPDLEASSGAEDEFWRGMAEIRRGAK
jgi:hypothetical protein